MRNALGSHHAPNCWSGHTAVKTVQTVGLGAHAAYTHMGSYIHYIYSL